jgi:fatty-acyl-CoA synthase
MAELTEPQPSIIRGIPLSEEPGLGTLTISGFIREVTERHGPREALVMHTPEGRLSWSYADLWERSLEIARALIACGVGKNSRVGVMMTNRPEWVAAFFGAAIAGATSATISTFSTPHELEQLLDMANLAVLLFEGPVLKKDFTAILEELEPEIRSAKPGQLRSLKYPFLRHLVVVGAPGNGGAIESWDDFLKRGQEISRELVEAAAATVKPADLGSIFFSSGSTGKPKGIMSAQRGIAIQLWRWRRMFAVYDPDVRVWTANGFFWSGNFGMALGTALHAGGAVILQQTFNAVEALELMEKERVSFPIGWPHQWAQLQQAPNWDDVDLSAVKYIVGQPGERHPTIDTDYREPMASYGNTETFTISASYSADTPVEIQEGTHGEALPGMILKIIDPLTGELLPRGERGEIAVKGATLMLGYLGIPLDETLDEDGFFATGDGGFINDRGQLIWEGRLNDIIKTGGANVSPAEINEAMDRHPAIKIGQAVGVPHETLGEMVVACVVLHPGAQLDEPGLQAFLKERLASFKVPRRILFLDEEDLSTTGSAKVKTGELRELAAKRLAAQEGAAPEPQPA